VYESDNLTLPGKLLFVIANFQFSIAAYGHMGDVFDLVHELLSLYVYGFLFLNIHTLYLVQVVILDAISIGNISDAYVHHTLKLVLLSFLQ
jgi:hypothetical protein